MSNTYHFESIKSSLTTAVAHFSEATDDGDQHLSRYPVQKQMCEEMLVTFGQLQVPISVWTEDPECKIFFPGNDQVKVGRQIKDATYTGNALRITEDRTYSVEELPMDLDDTVKFARRDDNGIYVTRIEDHLNFDLRVREKVNLRTHTMNVMVDMMQRLDSILAQHKLKDEQSQSLKKFMLLVCMLHDCGKYLATVFGDKNWKHLLTIPLARYLLKQMEMSVYEIELATVLIEPNGYGDLVFCDIFGYPSGVHKVLDVNSQKFQRLAALEPEQEWSYMNEDLFNDLARVYFLSDAIGGYSFVRVSCGYIRPGAIIAGGVNTGLKFYDVLSQSIESHRQQICLSNDIVKSQQVLDHLSTDEKMPEKTVLFEWFSSGQLRITELVRWFNEEKKRLGIKDAEELAQKCMLYEQDLFHEDAKEHLTEEEAYFVYKSMPILPKIHSRYNDEKVWGSLVA